MTTQSNFFCCYWKRLSFLTYFCIARFYVGSAKILWERLYFCARQVQEIPQIYWEPIVWVSHPSVFQAKEARISIQTSASYRSTTLNVLRIVEMKTYFSLLVAGWIISTLLKLVLDFWERRKKNPESSQWSEPRNICWTHWIALFIKLIECRCSQCQQS